MIDIKKISIVPAYPAGSHCLRVDFTVRHGSDLIMEIINANASPSDVSSALRSMADRIDARVAADEEASK